MSLFVKLYDSTLGKTKLRNLTVFLAASLQNWTESQGEVTSSVRAYSKFLAKKNTTTDNNIDAVITPLGDGSFNLKLQSTQRGKNAIDLQFSTDSSRVAAGDNSYCDGVDNLAYAKLSKATGKDATAFRYGEVARSTSQIDEFADNEIRQIQWKKKIQFEAIPGVPTIDYLFLDNVSDHTQLEYTDFCAEGIDLTITANVRHTANGATAMKMWKYSIGLLNDNGNLQIYSRNWDTEETGTWGSTFTTWDWTAEPYVDGNALKIKITLTSGGAQLHDWIYFHAFANISHVKAQGS